MKKIKQLTKKEEDERMADFYKFPKKGEKVEICHVCKKVKKPYTVILTNDIFSIIHHEQAREKGPICEKCDSFYAMTGEFRDASDEEFEVAKKAAWFANMMLKWWEREHKLSADDDIRVSDKRNWDGTALIAKWARKEMSKGGKKDGIKK